MDVEMLGLGARLEGIHSVNFILPSPFHISLFPCVSLFLFQEQC